jgi:hypothetical protein
MATPPLTVTTTTASVAEADDPTIVVPSARPVLPPPEEWEKMSYVVQAVRSYIKGNVSNLPKAEIDSLMEFVKSAGLQIAARQKQVADAAAAAAAKTAAKEIATVKPIDFPAPIVVTAAVPAAPTPVIVTEPVSSTEPEPPVVVTPIIAPAASTRSK